MFISYNIMHTCRGVLLVGLKDFFTKLVVRTTNKVGNRCYRKFENCIFISKVDFSRCSYNLSGTIICFYIIHTVSIDETNKLFHRLNNLHNI